MQCQCYAVFGLEGVVAFDSESAAGLLQIRSIQHFLQGFFIVQLSVCIHELLFLSASSLFQPWKARLIAF